MRELPDCLKRRYQALDSLMNELSEGISDDSLKPRAEGSTNDPGIKLMCRFWDILKEDPDCNLQEAVQQRMEPYTESGVFGPQEIACYNMAEKEKKKKEAVNEIETICCKMTSDKSREGSPCGGKKSSAATPKAGCCDVKKSPSASLRGSDVMPLSKVLCNLQDAASFDKKCSQKINALADVQKQVTTQIQTLEEREKQGIEMLKQADCMWSCMEDTYKKKISDSIERQKNLLKEQREVEGSLSKWRKNKKDLEQQMKNLDQCQKEMKEKLNQKNNDMKCINAEINDYKKRIESNTKDIEAAKKSLSGKKTASNNKMKKLAEEFKKLQEVVAKEEKLKKDKEDEGNKYIKEARDDLNTICRVLLQKKLENEDLKAEINAIIGEIELLKVTSEQCKDKCKTKQQNMEDELKKVNDDIANFRVRCMVCHKCVDTSDVRRFCTDCPRCNETRECIYADDSCTEDAANACVCMSVKHKFLDNVFENMYTVLERQVKTRPGKVLAEQVFSCLKKSRNGKLDDETKKALQDFVLATVKKNLNLTIIGGAVKTRCEMDSDTYNQLMLCLALITVTKVKPDKADKGTPARKDPCRRWGGTGECNCPGGPKSCVCSSKAPPPPNDPSPCPQLPEDKEDIGKGKLCPHQREATECGPDCANAKVPDAVKDLLSTWKPEACGGQSCTFTKNMRAAQCMLGPESLYSLSTPSKTKGYMTSTPIAPNLNELMVPHCECEPGKCTCEDITRSTGLKETKVTDFTTNLKFPDKTEPMPYKEQKIESDKTIRYETEKYHKRSVMEEEIRNSIGVLKSKMIEDKNIPLVQAQVMSRAYQERGTDPHIILDTNDQQRITLEQLLRFTNQNTSKELFKVAIPNEVGSLNYEFTEITTTSSGSIEMALDEKTIELIDSCTKENPNLFVILKKTLSGHYVMKFNKDQCATSESRKIVVNRTESGRMIMEVHKDLINTVQPEIILSKDTEMLSQMSSLPVGLTKKPKQLRCNQQSLEIGLKEKNTGKGSGMDVNETKGDFDILKYCFKETKKHDDVNDSAGQKNSQADLKSTRNMEIIEKRRHSKDNLINWNTEQADISIKDSSVIKRVKYDECTNNDIESLPSLEEEFRNMLLNNDTALPVTVIGENGVQIDLKAKITKTVSGHLAVDIKAMANLKLIAEQLVENPISLQKMNSKYLLKVSQDKDMANAALRRTSSGGIYAVIKDLVLDCCKNKAVTLETKEELYKIRVKGVKRVASDLTCSIRTTVSGNYMFVLDKEFKERYMQVLDDAFGDDSESNVNLSKTESGCYVIDFKKHVNHFFDSNNATLVKSPSENIKMFVKNYVFDAMETEITIGNESSNMLGELFKKVPPSSREFHREHLAKSKFLDTKSCSDSDVYGKVRIHDQKSSLTDPPAILKKTVSGQYTVVLNKESKVSFINNLKSYISKSGQNLIPIKKTNEGDIIICLNQDHKCQGHYGSLKITPSGNIYVFVDENVIKEIERKAVEDAAQTTVSELSSTSIHMIGTLLHPKNIAVTTTCNSEWDDNSCDESKCVCNELVSKMDSWGYNLPKEKSKGMGITWYQVVKSTDCSNKVYNPCVLADASKSSETDSEHCSNSENEAPKVGILRCTHTKSGPNPNYKEQCYYVIDTDRVTRKHERRSSSNELIQIIGPCFHGNWKDETEITEYDFEKYVVNDAKVNKKSDLARLDYLESLPPQLPPFLRG